MTCLSRARPSRLALVPLLLSLSCGPDTDSVPPGIGSGRWAVMGADDHGDSAVVGILTDRGDLFGYCTGTLIAPNLVLTARHCVAPNDNDVLCGSTTFGPADPIDSHHVTPDWDGPELQVPTFTFKHGNWFTVDKVFTPTTGDLFCGFDVALLQLKGSGVPSTLAQPLVPRIDKAPSVGETYSAVGFGATGPGLDDFGQRRRLDGLNVSCAGACTSTQVDPAREWMGPTGTCSGDSGGPALDENGQVIGVLSRGHSDCTAQIFESMVTWHDLIRQAAIDAAAAGGYHPAAWAGGGDAGIGAADASPAPDRAQRPDAGAVTMPDSGATTSPPKDAGGCAYATAERAGTRSLLLLFAVAGLAVMIRRRGPRR